MKKTLSPITWWVLVGVTSGCGDDGMLIAEVLPPGQRASEVSADRSAVDVAEEAAAVQQILRTHCAGCHSPSVLAASHGLPGESRYASAGVGDINDIDALIAAGLIVPGLPEESHVLTLMATGEMPPVVSGLPRVSAGDLRQLTKFIVRLDPPSEREVQAILLRNCGSCHAEEGGRVVLAINDIENIQLLVAAGLIVPGERDLSQVYSRILGGSMPPVEAGLARVPKRDLARLGGFIDLLR